MKKMITFLVTAALSIMLFGCAQQTQPEQNPQDDQTEQTQQEQQPEPEQTPQIEPEQTQQEPEPEPLTLTKDNVYEVVRPALQAYALAENHFAFANPVSNDEGYTQLFNSDGTVYQNNSNHLYEKSSEFKTIAEIKQYFNTYLDPEIYAWIDKAVANKELFELSDGVYQAFFAREYTAYYPETVTLEKHEGNDYEISVIHGTGGPSVVRITLRGAMEGNYFKIQNKTNEPSTSIETDNFPVNESLPEGLHVSPPVNRDYEH